MILSGEIIEVLLGREEDLEDGNETAAVTAAAMVVVLMLQKKKNNREGRKKEKEKWVQGEERRFCSCLERAE